MQSKARERRGGDNVPQVGVAFAPSARPCTSDPALGGGDLRARASFILVDATGRKLGKAKSKLEAELLLSIYKRHGIAATIKC